MSATIHFDNVSKQFDGTTVLDGFDLTVNAGEKIALIGASGSGKTTALRILMTLEAPSRGRVLVDGDVLWDESTLGLPRRAREAHLRQMRSRIGMIFQQFNLFPHMSVMRNLTEAPVHVAGLSPAAARERAEELLQLVGLESRADAFPYQLSGGQQQRVAIARALALRPDVLLLDEPTSALDPELVHEVLGVIQMLSERYDLTMLLVTHEMSFAERFADQICFLDRGKILERGAPGQVLYDSREPRTREFLKAIQ